MHYSQLPIGLISNPQILRKSQKIDPLSKSILVVQSLLSGDFSTKHLQSPDSRGFLALLNCYRFEVPMKFRASLNHMVSFGKRPFSQISGQQCAIIAIFSVACCPGTRNKALKPIVWTAGHGRNRPFAKGR
jgi:hypothetical protein